MINKNGTIIPDASIEEDVEVPSDTMHPTEIEKKMDMPMSDIAEAVVNAPETVTAVIDMAMDAVNEAVAAADHHAYLGMSDAVPMVAMTPGGDHPGIAAFASVNALVDRKAEIQAMLAEKNTSIQKLRLDFNAQVAELESEKDALTAEAATLPEKAREYLSQVAGRAITLRAIFGLND